MDAPDLEIDAVPGEAYKLRFAKTCEEIHKHCAAIWLPFDRLQKSGNVGVFHWRQRFSFNAGKLAVIGRHETVRARGKKAYLHAVFAVANGILCLVAVAEIGFSGKRAKSSGD